MDGTSHVEPAEDSSSGPAQEVDALDGAGDSKETTTETTDVVAESPPSGNRRRVLTFSIAGGVAAMAVIGVSAAVVANMGKEPVAAPSPSPSPSQTVSASPTPSPSPSGPPIELIPADSPGFGFPEAYVMTDEVLELVGEGWAVESYASRFAHWGEVEAPVTPAVIYLVDPEGRHFVAHTGPRRSTRTTW